jgi:protein gp37
MAETTIEWAKYTFNPWRGCEKIDPGCANCYAAAFAKLNPKLLGEWGPNGTRVFAAEKQWAEPLKWNALAACDCHRRADLGERHLASCPQSARPRVFCASMGDVFESFGEYLTDHRGEEMVADEEPPANGFTMNNARRQLFKLIDATPNLDWLLLTKRPENIRKMWPTEFDDKGFTKVQRLRPNVWLGTSVATQASANKFVPELLKVADLAPVLFISAEPLLESIDFRPWLIRDRYYMARCKSCGWVSSSHEFGLDSRESDASLVCPKCDAIEPEAIDARLALIIEGGESGRGARIHRPEWSRRILRDTRGTSTKFFLKQMGAFIVDRNDQFSCDENDGLWDVDTDVEHDIYGFAERFQGADCRIRLLDPKGGDPAEWPADLRVREMPTTEASR